MEQTVIF